jgi:8-oxo-dGTP diphosphatase
LAESIVHAAVAVLQRQDGQVLLAQRPEGKAWAGWWEFPGGKIEDGETAFEALQRELDEELGTQALEAYPWLTRSFAYPEKTVKLHFFIVRRWTDEPHGREGQHLSWQDPAGLTVSPMLPANEPILTALTLAPVYAVTNMADVGEVAFLERMEGALQSGLRLIHIREKSLSPYDFRIFASKAIALGKRYGAKVMLNRDIELARELGADGVHLPSSELMKLSERPQGLLCAGSCHNEVELAHAYSLALDFVVLSPVLPTLSHPDAIPLGWQNFTSLIKDGPLPVYALGGMHGHHLVTAWQAGAHGISMQRSAWGA